MSCSRRCYLDAKTFELLKEFAANGGKIWSLGDKPTMVDGAHSDELCEFMNDIESMPVYDGELLVTALTSLGIKKLTVSDKNGEIGSIHCRVNLLENGNKAYFFQNHDKEHGYDAKIVLPDASSAVILDLVDMSVRKPDTLDGAKTTLYMHFEPMKSYLVLTGNALPEVTVKEKPALVLPLGHDWEVEKADDNQLTLDTCSYILGEESETNTWSEPLNILDIMERLLAARANDKIKLRFTFNIDRSAKITAIRRMKLVSELTDDFTITVNGSALTYDGKSWWKDKTFKSFDIRDKVKTGENEIIVEGSFYQREKVYQVLFGKNVLETERNKLTYDTGTRKLLPRRRFRRILGIRLHRRRPPRPLHRRRLRNRQHGKLTPRRRNRHPGLSLLLRKDHPLPDRKNQKVLRQTRSRKTQKALRRPRETLCQRRIR